MSKLLLLLLQPFYSSLDFVRDIPGEPVQEETASIRAAASVSLRSIGWIQCFETIG